MPVPSNVAELLIIIRKSGVVEDAKLKAASDTILAKTNPPTTAKDMASALIGRGILTNFQAEQLLQGKWKRFSIGKYKILERIGAGGMGQVFLCEHKLMRRRVAVKVLPAAKSNDPASLERFYREARAVAAVDHPNIVRAYDIDQDDGIHFLVMEYVDGSNLQELVMKRLQRTQSPLQVLEACHYIFGCAVGLQHAHEMGLVHRDIKPGNVLVDRSGMVKLLDMGLARFFHDQDDLLTQKYDESILGTADYLAPEQAIDSHNVDIRADIYSLGATFYFLLTGKPPFPDGSIAQKLLWHQQRNPKPLSEYRQDVPSELETIVQTMMAKDPAQRYQTPHDVITALQPFIQTPISPPSDDELPRHSLAAGAGSFGTGRPIHTTGSSSGSMVAIGAAPASGWANGGYPTAAAVTTPDTVAPAVDSGDAVWGSLTFDTKTTKKDQTMSPTLLKKSQVMGKELPSKKPRPQWILPVALAGGVLFMAGVSYGVWKTINKPDRATASTNVPANNTGRLYVTKTETSPDQTRTFPTLAQALANAKPKDVITILDDVLNEGPIKLETRGKAGIKDVTIEAGSPSKTVTWNVLPQKAITLGDTAAIELVNTTNMVLRGVTINVGGHYAIGVSIVGSCAGLECDHVTITNAKKVGVKFTNAAGETGHPIVLNHLRVHGTIPLEAGVAFTSAATLSNKIIRIHDCRFEGPGQSAILNNGPLADVEISGNRIFNWNAAATLSGGLYASSPFQIHLQNNTIFNVKSAFCIDGDFPNGIKAEVTLKQNYFGKAGELVSFVNSKGFNFPGLKLIDNARDAKTKEGKISLLTLEVNDVELTNTDATSSQFLKYPRDSKLAQVGPNKVPVGIPPD